MKHSTRRSSVLAMAAALATAVTAFVVAPAAQAAPPFDDLPETVSADALAAPQMNGVVWRQVVAGSTVFAVGEFTRARPYGSAAGQNEVVRSHVLAYNIDTGAMTSFAPTINAQVMDAAVSPDGNTLYLVGQFTQVNGQSRYRIAAFDVASGALLPFRPVVNTRITSVTATSSTVYFGGPFTTVNGQQRTRVAAVNAGTGTTNTPLSASIPDGDVRGVALAPDGNALVIAGSFTSVNGSNNPGYGLARLATSNGASLSFPVNAIVRNATVNAAIYSLKSDENGVYGTGYDYYGPGNLEGSFHADWEGNLEWIDGCMGDTYDVWPDGDVVYQASHKHNCSQIGGFPQEQPWTYHNATAMTNYATGTNVGGLQPGQPAPKMLAFKPEFQGGTYTPSRQAVWTVTGNDDYILYAGEFVRVNGVLQQGLTRFARRDVAPNDQGPRIRDAATNPTVAAVPFAGLRVSWTANWDRDDDHLRYQVYRNDMNTLVYDQVLRADYWSLPTFGFIDSDLAQGQSAQYRLRTTDPSGNSTISAWVSGTAGTVGTSTTYSEEVRADAPAHYWPLGEPSGTRAYDWGGGADLTLTSQVARNVEGAITGDAGSRFTGSTNSYGSTTAREGGPQEFSVEAWFRRTGSGGGKIVGFGSSSSGNSSNYDRHIYMDAGGRVIFGVYPGTERTISTSGAYNDGEWHHVVGTLSPTGMRFYLDGELVGERTDTTSAQPYTGYWRVGGDSTWSGNRYFNGSIDEVAVYSRALDAATVAHHYTVGSTGVVPNQAPTASFTAGVTGLGVSVDASASSDPDGSIASYAWTFGDGQSGTGATASHTYAAAGTYTVTLTVTDDDGAPASTTRQVTVTAPPPNVAPTASFTSSATHLAASFNASASSDPDGTIAAYAWDFDDGQTGTGATPSHTYAAAGTYTVTLTVTDDDGATDSVSGDVTVTAPPANAPIAIDTFGRTQANGWGTATTGGAWTPTAGTAARFLTDGDRGVQVLHAPGATTGIQLAGVSQTNVEVRATLSADVVPTGGGAYLMVTGRRVGTAEYTARLHVQASGAVAVHLLRAGTPVVGGVVPGLSFAGGDEINVAFQVVGTSPTQLRVRVWEGGTPEPAGWTYSTTDSTASLQAAGSIGFGAYLSGSATNAPVRVSVDDLDASPVQ
ncbi:PKD domain containing protein [Beutenbergia cavernae DSM 12333]|uniref:PKD domain containing protein n=1 Tax=Beutenbergia cavernae (strain ATCC BAA-8 / DSM 12333 / CCUG 43141 / JCM 11478 / NBRC 16432 / NCIMB 13614 / HKI 0122) TaxID=471853 RepID=C5C072_BEUC1|nr:PKD domain-containing protein [Beutenbergia cavernae]ACQ79258.1 PKD domain containing protein [Beutenbergia cavernae DSM 12333]